MNCFLKEWKETSELNIILFEFALDLLERVLCSAEAYLRVSDQTEQSPFE